MQAENESRLNEQEGMELFDFLLIIAVYRKSVLSTTLVALVLGVIFTQLMRPTFRATAAILPPQQQQSAVASLMGQFGALESMGGANSLLKNPADIYVGMLQSRTIADRLIERFRLQNVYRAKTMEATRSALKKHTEFEATKAGLIHITVSDHDPERASGLANGFVDELHRMNSNLAVSEAAERRVFFDQQLAEEKTALARAEKDFRMIQEKTGLIQLGAQEESIIRSIAATRAEISSSELELEATRTYATDQNPEAIRIQQQIVTLKAQLASLENNQNEMRPGDTGLPAQRVPAAATEYAQAYRNARYHEQLFELLSKQSEAARIDEAKSVPLIQIVDRAVPPDQKAGLPRLAVIAGFGVMGFCLAALIAFGRHIFREWLETPSGGEKMRALRAALQRSARAL